MRALSKILAPSLIVVLCSVPACGDDDGSTFGDAGFDAGDAATGGSAGSTTTSNGGSMVSSGGTTASGGRLSGFSGSGNGGRGNMGMGGRGLGGRGAMGGSGGDPSDECDVTTAVPCDGPEDCPSGQQCCGRVDGATYVEFGCFDSCADEEPSPGNALLLEMCHPGQECAEDGYSCGSSVFLPSFLARCYTTADDVSDELSTAASEVNCGNAVCGGGEKCCLRSPEEPYCAPADEDCACDPSGVPDGGTPPDSGAPETGPPDAGDGSISDGRSTLEGGADADSTSFDAGSDVVDAGSPDAFADAAGDVSTSD